MKISYKSLENQLRAIKRMKSRNQQVSLKIRAFCFDLSEFMRFRLFKRLEKVNPLAARELSSISACIKALAALDHKADGAFLSDLMRVALALDQWNSSDVDSELIEGIQKERFCTDIKSLEKTLSMAKELQMGKVFNRI